MSSVQCYPFCFLRLILACIYVCYRRRYFITSVNQICTMITATPLVYPPSTYSLLDSISLFFQFLALSSSVEAIHQIYEIKGRKYTSPLAICVGEVEDIKRFAVTEHLPPGLLDCLLPGPVTVVLRRGWWLNVCLRTM